MYVETNKIKIKAGFLLYSENKAIHDADRSQHLFDHIIKVVTVAEAALPTSAIQKGVCFT